MFRLDDILTINLDLYNKLYITNLNNLFISYHENVPKNSQPDIDSEYYG